MYINVKTCDEVYIVAYQSCLFVKQNPTVYWTGHTYTYRAKLSGYLARYTAAHRINDQVFCPLITGTRFAIDNRALRPPQSKNRTNITRHTYLQTPQKLKEFFFFIIISLSFEINTLLYF